MLQENDPRQDGAIARWTGDGVGTPEPKHLKSVRFPNQTVKYLFLLLRLGLIGLTFHRRH